MPPSPRFPETASPTWPRHAEPHSPARPLDLHFQPSRESRATLGQQGQRAVGLDGACVGPSGKRALVFGGPGGGRAATEG